MKYIDIILLVFNDCMRPQNQDFTGVSSGSWSLYVATLGENHGPSDSAMWLLVRLKMWIYIYIIYI